MLAVMDYRSAMTCTCSRSPSSNNYSQIYHNNYNIIYGASMFDGAC